MWCEFFVLCLILWVFCMGCLSCVDGLRKRGMRF